MVGVLGNSGYAGESLFKMQPGGYPGGVVVDDELSLWHTAAPDRLERVSLDGRVIAAYKIENAVMGHPAHNVRLGVAGDYVVAMNVHVGKVFAMRRDADPAKDAMKPLTLDPPIKFWYGSGIGANGIKGRAIVDSQTAVHAVDPATGKTEKLFDLPQPITEHGIEVTPDGTIYATSGKNTWAFDAAGKVLREGPGMWGRLSAVTGGILGFGFNSVQRLAGGGAVSGGKDMAGGTLALQNLFWEPGVELGRLGQAAGISPTTYVFASQGGPIYIGDFSGDRITFTRRYGAATLTALGLSPEGEVFASCYGGVQAWHWDDAADAVPFYGSGLADILAVQQIASRGQFTFGIRQPYRPDQKMQAWTWPPTQYGIRWSDLEGERPARPSGVAITHDWRLVISAEKDRDLYLTQAREDGSVNSKVQKIAWTADNPLNQPGDLAGWSNGRVLVADGNAVVLVEPAGDKYREAWRFSSWGEKPDQKFGDEIHVATSGDCLLASDTQRHRVLLFSLPERALLAQIGTTDKAGTAAAALDQPAQIAATGLRVAIFDRGNQRITKCEIKP